MSADWRAEELRIEGQLAASIRSMNRRGCWDAKWILELANRAYFLCVTRKPAEKADLLRKVLLNCSIDGVSLYPSYRKLFDVIAKRVKKKNGRDGQI